MLFGPWPDSSSVRRADGAWRREALNKHWRYARALVWVVVFCLCIRIWKLHRAVDARIFTCWEARGISWIRVATSTRRRVSRRIEVFTSTAPVKIQNKKSRKSRMQSKNGIARQIQIVFDQMQSSLVRAEIDVRTQDFVIRWAFITICSGVIGFLLRGIVTAIFLIGFSFFGTFLYVKLRENRRLHRFEEGLHDMLTI